MARKTHYTDAKEVQMWLRAKQVVARRYRLLLKKLKKNKTKVEG